MSALLLCVLFLYLVTDISIADTEEVDHPNIIFMFCDDCGINDFGYNGNTETLTPFIDSLVSNEGLVIKSHYVYKLCSPTRASFLTGRYSSALGLQYGILLEYMPYSLTRQVSTLSNEFQSQDYTTHAIGKWHLGFQSWEYTPTYRGFDTFNGFYNFMSSYFTHTFTSSTMKFYDLRSNEEPVMDAKGIYGPDWQTQKAIQILHDYKKEKIFMYLAWQSSHEPSEAPFRYIKMYCDNGMNCDSHHMHQAQMSALDDNVKKIVYHLKQSDMWSNTLLIFVGDNGAIAEYGDNAPLRSYKKSPFEGGLRVPAFVSGGYLNSDRYGQVLTEFPVHISDWYPTLLSAAGLEITHAKSHDYYQSNPEDAEKLQTLIDFNIPLDGKDLWSFIQHSTTNDDTHDFIHDENENIGGREILLDIADNNCHFSSCGVILYQNRWKYLRGNNLCYEGVDCDTWAVSYMTEDTNILGCESYESMSDSITSLNCLNTETGCLIDLFVDPCEYTDVAHSNDAMVKYLQMRLDEYSAASVIELDTHINSLENDEINPSLVCPNDYWCPFQAWEDIVFENVLYKHYMILYSGNVDGVHVANYKKRSREKIHEKVEGEMEEKKDSSLVVNYSIWIGIGVVFFGMVIVFYKYIQRLQPKVQVTEIEGLLLRS